MRKMLRSAVLALAVGGVAAVGLPALHAADAPAPAAKQDGQADVPVKVVVLFSSGVGYFEHVGAVRGNASTELRFKTQQINDILKSLVLQDTGGGKVGTIVYPSQDPVGKLLKSFQVDITANPSMAELLNQLRGAKVRVTAGTETLAATILGVEKKQKAVEKGHVEVWVLNLVAGGTIRSVPLDDVTKLELEDPGLQEELSKALAALAGARDQDKKPVTITFAGEGERMVRLGYVVETPVWKTSYRLLLDPEGKKNNLQGWAIVENQTDNDWSEVQLSLVSGRPISFIQELYQPLYVPRPVVQPELYASLRPQTYEGGIGAARERLALANATEAETAAAAPMPRPAAARADRAGRGGGLAGGAMPADGAEQRKLAEVMEKQFDASASTASVASASKVGELFQYTVGNVTLPRQRSAMLPIITDPVEVEKLSIYNAAVLAKHPLNGARVKNTTGKHLLQGPITVLEGSTYAGDARVDNLPPGQERLLSYGVDLQVLVNATKNKTESSILSGKIVKGVLNLQRKHQFTQEYVAENKAEKDKTLILEHPFRQNWKLLEPEKPLETTESLYRFKTTLPAGKSGAFTVKEEHVQSESLAILPMDVGTLDFYSKSGQIDPKVKDALARAVQLKHKMTDAQRQQQRHQQQLNQITQEQSRIRENLKTVPEKSALHTRLLEKLTEQEKQIDGLYTSMDNAQKAFEAARKELEDYVNNLNVD